VNDVPNRILDLLGKLADKAETVLQYRALVAEAAMQGDLDLALERFSSANQKARDFIEGGS